MTWSWARPVNIVAAAHVLVQARKRLRCETMGYDCGSGYGGRRYYSRDEKIEWLQGYAQELENELKGVKERLAEVKASAEA